MAITSDQLAELVRNGGSASVDANDYAPTQLIDVARSMPAKVTLILRKAEALLTAQRIEIARSSGGTVLFEL